MSHRRTSGAKVRLHKIGVGNGRFARGKQTRLANKRMLWEFTKDNEPLA